MSRPRQNNNIYVYLYGTRTRSRSGVQIVYKYGPRSIVPEPTTLINISVCNYIVCDNHSKGRTSTHLFRLSRSVFSFRAAYIQVVIIVYAYEYHIHRVLPSNVMKVQTLQNSRFACEHKTSVPPITDYREISWVPIEAAEDLLVL